MDRILWILQVITAIAFIYSGICKSMLSERKLVVAGQTGVEGLNPLVIKAIGFSEVLGSIGLIAPVYYNILPIHTPVAAICLAMIMPFAARIHFRRKEYRNVVTNIVFFLICAFIAVGRLLI